MRASYKRGNCRASKQPPGELLSLDQVDLRLLGQKDLDLPRSDPELTREVVGLLGRMADRYAIAVLDVSDPAAPRYAEHGGEVRRNPGSVGKLCAALAVFQALADIYPPDEAARLRVLRDSMITADAFVLTDSHSVRLYQPGGKTLIRHPLRVGDRGSLYEFLDWMLSESSNSAAAVVMQQAMLLRHYKTAYPVTPEVQGRFPGTRRGASWRASISKPSRRPSAATAWTWPRCARAEELGRGPPDARHPAPSHRKTPSATAVCSATMIASSDR